MAKEIVKENVNDEKTEAQKTKTPRKPKKVQEVYIEYMDKQIEQQEFINKAVSFWVAEGNKKSDIVSTKVYIQPETGMVYFVINDNFYGSFEF